MRLPDFKMNCRYCGDTGVILAKVTDGSGAGDYAFLCWCTRGQLRGARYPKWNNQDGFKMIPASGPLVDTQ